MATLLVGTSRHTLVSGLVGMYFCRAEFSSFGDGEAKGEIYGYGISREGWMDDIYGLKEDEEVDGYHMDTCRPKDESGYIRFLLSPDRVSD